MPKVSEPPLTGRLVLIPFSPRPLVRAAPATPASPRAPKAAAPAPSATPPARNDRRSNDCVIATPQRFRLLRVLRLRRGTTGGRLQLRDCMRAAADWGLAWGYGNLGVEDQRARATATREATSDDCSRRPGARCEGVHIRRQGTGGDDVGGGSGQGQGRPLRRAGRVHARRARITTSPASCCVPRSCTPRAWTRWSASR